MDIKLDGERMLCHKLANGSVKWFTRRANEYSHLYGPVMNDVIQSHVHVESCVLDGEMVRFEHECLTSLFQSDSDIVWKATNHAFIGALLFLAFSCLLLLMCVCMYAGVLIVVLPFDFFYLPPFVDSILLYSIGQLRREPQGRARRVGALWEQPHRGRLRARGDGNRQSSGHRLRGNPQ